MQTTGPDPENVSQHQAERSSTTDDGCNKNQGGQANKSKSSRDQINTQGDQSPYNDSSELQATVLQRSDIKESQQAGGEGGGI